MKRGHIPHRTCKACGRSAPKNELIRLVLRQGEPVEDIAQKALGRGVYCCAETSCRNRLLTNRKKLNRAFRLQG
ncbi:MAG: DUF448 domain-containing protein [Deltaproteobacteria bacterium]|nr:DUF448 domain-containing protein [Deltaproteobacteria bacterium]